MGQADKTRPHEPPMATGPIRVLPLNGAPMGTLGMSFDNDSGLQWWLNLAGVEFSKKETRTCTYRASIFPLACFDRRK